jgi:RNA polymerase sigma-70 factor (ECF subfamily)
MVRPALPEAMTNETAQTMRGLWFRFLDEIEPLRPKLHAYCLRLTGSIFDAEDLSQETLLRAFAAIGQGDLSAGASPISNARAWLSRVATNLWIDGLRAGRRGPALAPSERATPVSEPAVVTTAAAARLFELTGPQERAAIVLKDVFDFSLEEIAAILATTVGAVKSALHRGRGKLAETPAAATRPLNSASAELVDRFVAAFNARDLPTLTSLLLDSVVFEARGVGGERGRDAIWLNVNGDRPAAVSWERRRVDGCEAMLVFFEHEGERKLTSVSRFEEADGLISRHVTYFFCPDTVRAVAEQLGVEALTVGYHQAPETLARMISDAKLPWAGL